MLSNSKWLPVLLFVCFAGPTQAVELREIEVRTGTEGLTKVPISITNNTSQTVSCIGELAHWYSTEVAKIEGDSTTRFDLWFDPITGTLTLLNEHDENMPVESLWCGFDGRAFASRSRLNLARHEGKTPNGMRLSCREMVTAYFASECAKRYFAIRYLIWRNRNQSFVPPFKYATHCDEFLCSTFLQVGQIFWSVTIDSFAGFDT